MTRGVLIGMCVLSGCLSFWGARMWGERSLNPQAVSGGESRPESSKVGGTDGKELTKAVRETKPMQEHAAEVEELRKRLRAIEQGAGSLWESRLAVMAAIQGMSVTQLSLLIEDASESADLMRWVRFDVAFAARRLSEIAPMEATRLWEKNEPNPISARSMLAPWAARDPEAFGTWVKSLPQNIQEAARWAVYAMARDKPEQFSVLAPLLGDSPAGPSGAKAAIERMITDAGGKGDPGAALDYSRALPAGPIRDKALVSLAKWPGLDLAQYPEVLTALGKLQPDDALIVGRSLTGSAEKLPAGVVRESAFTSLIQGEAEKDPVAATKRLEALAGSVDYPASVVGFVGATASKDPAAAADWALSIGTQAEGKRIQALERVARAWFSKTPEAARVWVEKAPLTDREYFILTGRVRGK